MHYLDLTLPTVAENLALDEALLLQAEANGDGETLRFWEWPRRAVVLGAGGKIAEDVIEESCRSDGVPILRRSSGGGTVLLGRGCLCFTLVLSMDRDPALREIRPSYYFIVNGVREALRDSIPDLEHAGISDMAIDGRKVSGSAQQRKRRFILHHATLLYDFDCSAAERYLRLPRRQPDYRGRRSHGDFMRNMPVGVQLLREALVQAWNASHPLTPPLQRVRELVEQKYGRGDWIRKR